MKIFINYLLYRLIGKKPKSSGESIKPRGVSRTLVSREFEQNFKWERDKFKNVIEI